MHEYTSRKRTQNQPEPEYGKAAPAGFFAGGMPNSALQAVLRGSSSPDSNMMGHRENLAQSVEAKMSRAFGMDLSQLKLYRTDAMSDSGMEGLSSGNKIVLSKDIDLNTLQGQAVLGHEISHLHAQSFGLGMGHTGLYENAALEKQADAEGALAARGLHIDGSASGMAAGQGLASISSLSPLGSGLSASAGAPMQAKKNKGSKAPESSSPKAVKKKMAKAGLSSSKKNKSFADMYSDSKIDNINDFYKKAQGMNNDKALSDKLHGLISADPNQSIGGTRAGRIFSELSDKKATGLNDNKTVNLARSLISTDPEIQQAARLQLREIRYKQLEGFEKKYGRMFEQMDPSTLLDDTGINTYADLLSGGSFQDAFKESSEDLSEKNTESITFGDEQKDERYRQLERYYTCVQSLITGMPNHLNIDGSVADEEGLNKHMSEKRALLTNLATKDGKSVINGPMLTKDQLNTYNKMLEDARKQAAEG